MTSYACHLPNHTHIPVVLLGSSSSSSSSSTSAKVDLSIQNVFTQIGSEMDYLDYSIYLEMISLLGVYWMSTGRLLSLIDRKGSYV